MTVERSHESIEPITRAAARLPREAGAEPAAAAESAGLGAGRAPGGPRLEIVSVIDEDAAGRLLLADVDGRERVAIYFVRPGLVEAPRVARFLRDAALLREVRHPSLAAVRGAGVEEGAAGAQPFLVLDPPLEPRARTPLAHAEHHHLPARKRLELLASIAEGAAAAHARGVAIRSIRPNAIAVDEAGRAVVRPIGIAAATAGDAIAASMRSDVGHLIDAVPYLSPEQSEGDGDAVDLRSDVWALGVIGFELLTGRLPFDLAERDGPSGVRLAPSRPPRSIRTVNRMFRGDVDAIIGRALAVDPSRRYADAGAFARDLRDHLAGRALSGRRRASRASRALGALVPRRAPLAILTTLAILLLASAAFWWLLPAPTSAVREPSVPLPRAELEESLSRAHEALDAAERERRAAQALAAEERDKRALLESRLDAQLAAEALASEQARTRLDALVEERNRALDAVDELSGERDGAVRAAERVEAWRAYVEGELLPALAGLGRAGDATSSIARLEAAALAAARALDGAPLLEAAARLAIGRALAAAGEWAAAEREIGAAVVLRERELPAGDDRVIEARELLVAARREALGRDDPRALGAVHHLAVALAAAGRADEAEPLFLEALEGRRRLGESDEGVRETLRALTALYEAQGRRDEAEELQR